MPKVNRDWFNTLIDDDGSNTIGSPWNKTAIAGAILDPVDLALKQAGAYPSGLGPAVVVPLTGGIYNNIYPGAATIWAFNPSAPITITGFANPVDGAQYLLLNTTGQAITLANQHAGSVVVNRLIGPGYADFVLGTWRSVWIVYLTYVQAWVIQKEG